MNQLLMYTVELIEYKSWLKIVKIKPKYFVNCIVCMKNIDTYRMVKSFSYNRITKIV